ncbi:hydantoinase/oxoprolinase family protein [Roseobacter sp.]|uniref:hydantoinase/oxoprolinase family protein n=1 Tax=Roseobacter sp. TaxID=1907202 RepID=UPI00329936F8
MSMFLGVDTGGTYTDAVLMQDEDKVIASAKALTTREDLAIGVGTAVRAVLQAGGVAPGDIALASLSTTLATNALVEGQGGRVGLIYIGFRARDLETHGLAAALKDDPFLICAGGHDHAGAETTALDDTAIRDFLETYRDGVTGYAVAAQFATRNPAHELRAAALVADITGRPVSASHQLSSRLNGPKRALTAVLNARLIGMIDRLIGRAETVLQGIGITAPMMVVRGDGALISADQARARPIETILSGPAASIVGARWLTGAQDAMVGDIGGTTTDIALLRDGKPAIDADGARVGPYRTMVEAVAMRTSGLGGDSEVHLDATGLQGRLTLGPQRVLPVSLLATQAPDIVHDALDRQLRSAVPDVQDARFVRGLPDQSRDGLTDREIQLLDRMGDALHPLANIVQARIENGALARLVERGAVQLGGVTASDASHVLGRVSAWDAPAAEKALQLFARKRQGTGQCLAGTAQQMAQMIVDQLTRQTTLALVDAALSEDAADIGPNVDGLAAHPLMQAGLANHRGVLRVSAGLNLPVIGLGASARSYYPAVGQAVGAQMILPEHGDVANAIGAVVGRVTMRQDGDITSPAEGRYRVHLPSGPMDFNDETAAFSCLETNLRDRAQDAATRAGVEKVQITVACDIRRAQVETREVFVEATVTVTASGRPRIAT